MKLRIFFFTLLLISLYFGATYFIDFFHQYDLHYVLDLKFFMFIALAIILQLLANLIRAGKSKYLLGQIRDTNVRVLFEGLSVGYLFNSLLPMRLGEFVRAYYTGDALSISKTTVFISIVFERIVDGFILGVCFFFSGFVAENFIGISANFMLRAGTILALLSLILLLLIQFIRSENKLLLRLVYSVSGLFNDRLSSRFRLMAWSGIYGTRLMLSNKIALRKYYVGSFIMWIFYFLSTAAVAIGFFNWMAISKVWYVVQSCFAGVGTLIGPGYIGAFNSIVSKQVDQLGVGNAVEFAVFAWFIFVIPTSIIGLFVIIRRRLGEKTSTPKQSSLINKLYRENDISSEFKHFLDAYFRGEQINQILTQAELNNNFNLIRAFKGGSNAHTMLVWQNEELRVKKITLIQYADKLEAQATWLLDRADCPNLPKVIEQERTDQYYSFDLEYKEDFFPFFEFIHSHSQKESIVVINKVLKFMDKHIYKSSLLANNKANVDDYIRGKVLGKVTDTANMNNEVAQLFSYKKIRINGVLYDNLSQIIELIQANKSAMLDLSRYRDSPIHGDLTIDNLIVSAKGDFMVIDPNNENQVSTPVVDYGKLYQSLHSGYEFLIQLEECVVKDNEIHFEDAKSQKYEAIFTDLDLKLTKKLSRSSHKAIVFHEAVHYCRMLTYRATIDPSTVAVFYATAVKLFNEYLDQYA